MHSLGNDFMVLNCVSNPQNLNADLIRAWSNRKLGIGFDQLLVIAPPTVANADFDYLIFNADGTEAQQCGNGTRCVAFLANHLGLSKSNHLLWNSAGGMIETTRQSTQHIETLMPAPILEHKDIPFIGGSGQLTENITLDEQTFCVTPVSMGNPHGVIFVDSLLDLDVQKIGGALTGACAAVVAAHLNGHVNGRVKVSLPGGKLRIHWSGRGQPVVMSGDATLVHRGEIVTES